MKAKDFVLTWNGGANGRAGQFAVHVGGQLQWTPFLKKPEHNPHAIPAERFTHTEAVALAGRLTGQRNLMIGEV